MLRRSRIFSIALKVFVPIAVVAMPIIAFASNGVPTKSTQTDSTMSVISYAQHPLYMRSESEPVNFSLRATLSEIPKASGDKINITFTVTNNANINSRLQLNELELRSRLLSTDSRSTAIYKFPLPIHADSSASWVMPYTFDGSQDLVALISDVRAAGKFARHSYNQPLEEPLITSNPTPTPVIKYTGPKVRSVTETSDWGKFELTAGFDRTPKASGDEVNIIFTIKSGNSIQGNKPRFNTLSNITLYSNRLSQEGQNPDSLALYTFPHTKITETNEITWTLPYTYKGSENLIQLLSSVSAEGTARFSTHVVQLKTGTPVDISEFTAPTLTETVPPQEPTPPADPTPPVNPTPTTQTSISISRVAAGDGTFKFVVTNNGSASISGIQILDNESSSASFNVVKIINSLSPQQRVEFSASKLANVQAGFTCQAWYHEPGSNSGKGVPCTTSSEASTTSSYTPTKSNKANNWSKI